MSASIPLHQSQGQVVLSLQFRFWIQPHKPESTRLEDYLKSWVDITSLVGEDLILQTTPPDPPDSRAMRSRIKSPKQEIRKCSPGAIQMY